ncbi:ABC transporter ATP-binding protein [Riemerella columbina]|uniref:ABC transporter ATP-binding protein n=1 Tax=Riemerella columbina TaxID=103810 RepID=UPI00037EF2E7|nr:ABC transporter ATP-binding protein [Riemerella columbina]
MNIIELNHLSFAFSKGKSILKNINLNVPKGSIYGFLGANGAGKSTTMKLMMGTLNGYDGNISLFNQDIKSFYPQGYTRIGSLIDYPAFYEHLSGFDNLKVVALIRELSLENIDRVLEMVELSDAKHIKLKKYSLGMKQRLAIALALVSQPELLVLDEPVNGLDPQGMIKIRQLLIKLNQELGITIFISSHLLQEIDKMVTHLGIISNGEMKFEGSREDLKQLFTHKKVSFKLHQPQNFIAKIPTIYRPSITAEQEIMVEVEEDKAIAELNKILVNHGAEVFEINAKGGLEEWFVDITK